MNHYIKYISAALLLSFTALQGCGYFDVDESYDYDKEGIFSSYTRAKQMVTNIYSYLPSDFCQTEGGMLDAATDDAVHIYTNSKLNRMNNGTWSPSHTVNDVWGHYYEGIRAANLYLAEAANLDFSEWKHTDNYEDIMKDFKNYPYEVRFLRAYYYFELMRRYKNVPLVLKVLKREEANSVEQADYATVAAFIVKECAEIAAELPVDYSSFHSKEYGRITKGAALALKSRVLLYMASPLYSEIQDAGKWKEAAKAAYEVIDPGNALGYTIQKGFRDLYLHENAGRKDIIMYRPVGETGSFESANFPMGIEGGSTTTCPTQNLMEAFEFKLPDGKYHPFDWNVLENQKNPYENRDPRMEMTLVRNGQKWLKETMEIWEGGANGQPIVNSTATGYYLCKYVNHNISFAAGSKTTKMLHNWVLFNYSEILLNYAEAMVNATGNPAYTDAELPLSAVAAVNIIRSREDVGMPAIADDVAPEEFLKIVKNERRVELAFEGHRFWDVRRWKELDKTAEIYGVKVVKDAAGEFKYTKFLYEKRPVSDKMYFFPISDRELHNNPNLKQNENWR